MAKVTLVSLGCPKNLVDSEGALGEVVAAGHELVADPSDADVVIVNTCGFIESAREESVQAIEDAVALKESGTCQAVVVIGCLSQRYGELLIDAEPGIDAVLGVGHVGRLRKAINDALIGEEVIDDRRPPRAWKEPRSRIRSTPPWTAYLKISDGCDNRCSYCAIPDIRGRYRSRPEPLIVDEAERLADEGVRELILVGQDLTQYGTDMGAPDALPGLLEKLASVDGPRWIRLMYCYPTKITRELIRAIASVDKVVKYIDLPMQHADDRVLAAMNRRGTSADYLQVIDELREACPEIALRSTFITGFPGETQAAFDRLAAFVERIQFDRVGVFAYSREEGTPAYCMDKHVDEQVAVERRDKLMRRQQKISLKKNRQLVGRGLEVLVEARTEDGVVGRSYRDAPEIDGLVHISDSNAAPGDFVTVTIGSADDYDLYSRESKVTSRESEVAG